MGVLGLAQPLALSTPLTNAQLPFPLFIAGNEVSGGTGTTAQGADASTFKLRDPGFAGPSILSFTIHDHTLAVYPWIAKQQEVLWLDAVNNRNLFWGTVTDLVFRPTGPWVDIDVTCTHTSAALDYAKPITTWDAGTHGTSDQAMIGSLVGQFSQERHLGSGGFIQALNASTMPSSIPVDRSTLRNAVDSVLAASGITGAVAYVDNYGYLHTMAVGDVNAPFNISDSPNFSTTVPAALNTTTTGASDVDALYVFGATAAGSGPVYAWQCGITTPPRLPLRWATMDAPNATTAAAAIAAATVEFQRRQNATTVNFVVVGDSVHGNFDGWAKGQYVTITSVPLGWSAKAFTISAVDMDVISGKGMRRYTMTAGSDPVLFTARLRNMKARWTFVASSGAPLRGRIGGTLP